MAHVYNPATGKVLFSQNTTTYTSQGWIRLTLALLEPVIGSPDGAKAVEAAVNATLPYWIWDGTAFSLMSQAEQNAADAAVAASALIQAKVKAHAIIEANTAFALQIQFMASKTPTQINNSDAAEKAVVDAMTDPATVNAYTDPRLPNGPG